MSNDGPRLRLSLWEAYEEYIALLVRSEAMAWPIAALHGFECPPEMVEEGKRLREHIAAALAAGQRDDDV